MENKLESRYGYAPVKYEKGERGFEYAIEDERGIARGFVRAEYFEGRYLLYKEGHLFGIENNEGAADERLKQKVSETLDGIKIQQERQARYGIPFD